MTPSNLQRQINPEAPTHRRFIGRIPNENSEAERAYVTWVTRDLEAVTWRYFNSVRPACQHKSLCRAIAPAKRDFLPSISYVLSTLTAFLPAARLMAPRGFPRCIFRAEFYAVRGSRLGYRPDSDAAATRSGPSGKSPRKAGLVTAEP